VVNFKFNLLQIGDFGRAFDLKSKKTKNLIGNTILIPNHYSYAAPEWIDLAEGFIPTEKCDVYR